MIRAACTAAWYLNRQHLSCCFEDVVNDLTLELEQPDQRNDNSIRLLSLLPPLFHCVRKDI